MGNSEDGMSEREREMERRAARARAALEAMAADYVIWTLADVDKCQALLNELTELFGRDTDAVAIRLPEIHAIAHNIKGQGTSFGYPLATRIAASLCRFTRHPRPVSATLLDLAGAHLEALRTILLEGMKDESAEAGKARAEILEREVGELMSAR